MNKKILQIQTNFLQEEEAHSPIVTTSKINYEQKLQAASLLQKILSIILAKNFIECWGTLKQHDPTQQDVYKHIRTTKTNNINPKVHINPVLSKETQQRVRYFETNPENNQKPRTQSYANRLHRLHTQQLSQQERQPKRNKSVRMINQQVEHSRASILQEIVDKLKNIRKVNDIQQSNNNQANEQILKKITHLERMIRNIKNQERCEASPPHYRSPFSNQKHDRNRSTNDRHNIQIQSNSVDNSQEDEELMKTFLTEIQHIRKEIKEIKLNNEAILRSELQRSRASSVSARYNHRPKENNYYIPVQMMPPYMSFNPNYNPNMNPSMNIPHNMNNHQNQMQQTYSQSNFKSEQKTRPQTNSHTQTLSQAPTQTQFQVPRTNKNNSMELKKTISEGVQTQSVQKNTIYTETEQTKFKSSNKYSSQTDGINSRKPVSNHQIDYRVPYRTEQKYQANYEKIKPFSNLYKDQPILQTKLKYPYLNSNWDSRENASSNIYKDQQNDIFNYKTKEKSHPPSSSNFNQSSGSNYNIPEGQISKLMKKIQGISSFIESQSKNKHENQVPQQINPVSTLNSSLGKDNKYHSMTYQTSYRPPPPYQPNPKPNQQPQQIYKMQPAPQFHSQVYSQASQPINYPKPQTHTVQLSIPQQPYPVRSVNDYTSNNQIKSNEALYSKNNVYNQIDSSYSLGFPKQVNHFRNPSIQVIKNQSTNIRPNVNFTNFCSVCGRNCGCPRNFTNAFRN